MTSEGGVYRGLGGMSKPFPPRKVMRSEDPRIGSAHHEANVSHDYQQKAYVNRYPLHAKYGCASINNYAPWCQPANFSFARGPGPGRSGKLSDTD